MIITTTYEGPDLDGYSCAVAYAELLRVQDKDATAAIFGEPQLEVRWLLREFNINPIGSMSSIGPISVALLDASGVNGLPKVFAPEQVVEIIDHRPLHFLDAFPNAHGQIELVGAAATLVAERFKNAGVEPSSESTVLLYGGILSNTQNFKGSQVTDRDHTMAAWLKELANIEDDFVERMFTAKSDLAGERLHEAMLGDAKVVVIEGVRVGTTQLEIFGTEMLWQDREDEIRSLMEKIAVDDEADILFLNMKDLETGNSLLIALDEKTKAFLSQVGELHWDGLVARSNTYTLRKQITSEIKKILESSSSS